jgi:hypothetical protein
MSRDSLSLMPGSRDSEIPEGDDAPKMSWLQRLRYAIVVPDSDPGEKVQQDDRSAEELDEAIRYADDKERTIGLIAAPLGALVAVLVGSADISHAQTLHQSTSTYEELLGVLALMSVLMLVMALLRKRLFLGIVMALYGLSIFNLHYWGFGIPFIMGGAWYLVRAYRLQQKYKLASPEGSGGNGRGRAPGVLPRPNKRYTPPTAQPRRPAKPKPGDDR